jgi:hypothetical protein
MIDVEMLAMSVPVCPGLRFCKHLSVSMARYATLLGCVLWTRGDAARIHPSLSHASQSVAHNNTRVVQHEGALL